jgi:hypothetical protein
MNITVFYKPMGTKPSNWIPKSFVFSNVTRALEGLHTPELLLLQETFSDIANV